MKSVPHKTFKDLHFTICSEKNKRNFQRTFSRVKVIVYNNLKPGKHIFRSSNKVFFTSRQNFEASLTVVHTSSVQGCIPLYLNIFRAVWDCKIKQILKPFKAHSQISKSVFPVSIINFFDSFSHSAHPFKRF